MPKIHSPFSRDAHPDLTRTISEIVAPKKPKQPVSAPHTQDKYTVPAGKTDPRIYAKPAKGTVHESHTRAALEKMSITQLRELLKKYSGKPGSGRELADIRGLLRAKGAGSVLDEARKGLGKTRYGQALKKLGDAAERIKANPPKPPVNPFKKPVQEAMTPCEKSALARLKSANTADLQDKPGAAGTKAHKRLHKTIARVVGEEVESVDEGILGRVKKKLQRAGETIRGKYGRHPKDELWAKQNRHAIAAATERRKREAEERRKREAEERKHPKPKPKTKTRSSDDWSPSSGDDGGWMGAVGI